jgi:hypothetical protein
MKIAINLVGVSYTELGRTRKYTDSYDSFIEHIVNPLKEQGHDISFYLSTYDSDKRDEIIETYNPVKSTFLDRNFALLGGGDVVDVEGKPMLIMVYTYLNSLLQIKEDNPDIDIIISTRFDMMWKLNPFENFNFDFNKFNFLFRDHIYTENPLACDTFYVFPYNMIDDLISAIVELNDNPYNGVKIGLLNLHHPLKQLIGSENVNIVCDEFLRSDYNSIYDLKRKE